jgi:hypothetical protein
LIVESIYVAFASSILRSMLLVAGGWLVSRGLVDDNGLMREVASGLSLIVVTQVWSFWRIHKRELYQRWLVLLGLRERMAADTGRQALQADYVVAMAKSRTKDGLQP